MFVREAGKRFATPLFLVLVFVELTDVVFAVDSVPAVLAVSRSQFIVFTSNAFAILGLRAIYFLLAGAKDALVHLNVGLGVILAFVGRQDARARVGSTSTRSCRWPSSWPYSPSPSSHRCAPTRMH